MAGDPLSAAVTRVPLCSVFLTAKASFASDAAAARVSSKVMVSVAPFTVAEEKAGAVMSCACAAPAPSSRASVAASRHAVARHPRARRTGRREEGGGEGAHASPAGWRSGRSRLAGHDADGGAVTPEHLRGADAPVRSGALALWRSGALALWRSALWRSGALALWRS